MSTSNLRAKFALECELKVIRKYSEFGYTLLYHRKKIFEIEIDLIFYHVQLGVVMVEVKSNLGNWAIHERITEVQIRRLYATFLKLQNYVNAKMYARVVCVGKDYVEHSLFDLLE